jgi:hypothetical protein
MMADRTRTSLEDEKATTGHMTENAITDNAITEKKGLSRKLKMASVRPFFALCPPSLLTRTLARLLHRRIQLRIQVSIIRIEFGQDLTAHFFLSNAIIGVCGLFSSY